MPNELNLTLSIFNYKSQRGELLTDRSNNCQRKFN